MKMKIARLVVLPIVACSLALGFLAGCSGDTASKEKAMEPKPKDAESAPGQPASAEAD